MSNKGDIRVMQFSNYVKPKLEENKQRNWVLNGRKNSFYQYIIDRYNGSVTNATIINSYINLIIGRGLVYTNGSNKLEDWTKFRTILSSDDLRKVVSDFELFGEASVEITKTNGGDLSSITHLPKQKVVPSIANEDNEIVSYWYCEDWSNTNKNTPEEYPAFGYGGRSESEIHVIRPYKAGKDYFADPDYMACLQYCLMEEEIANYYVNHIKNGLSFGYIINIPNGQAYEQEEKDKLERQITQKLTGSTNAGRFILNFQGGDEGTTVESIDGNSAHKQWEFLVTEARQQILTGHQVTSPMLFGIKDNTGLGNNANELDEAEVQLMKRVIKPKQEYITKGLEYILNQFGINLDLEFKPLTETKPQPVETEMSKVCLSDHGATSEMADVLIEFGTDGLDGYDLLCMSEVDYDTDDDIYSLLQFATSTGVARPNAKSEQDSDDIVIRYRYVGNPNPEREFCRKMMKANKLYRKEDILQMERAGINDGFGLNGTNTYSIWLWKGGGKMSEKYPNGTCKHKWQREIYLKRGGGVDVNSPLAQTITTTEARRKGFRVPKNPKAVSRRPHGLKNKS